MSGYDHAADLHNHAARIDPRAQRAWPTGPIGDALFAIATRLADLQREEARHGTSLLFRDPRDLAAMVTGTAKAGQLVGRPETFATAGALAVAAWVAATRAQELDVSAGDAA